MTAEEGHGHVPEALGSDGEEQGALTNSPFP